MSPLYRLRALRPNSIGIAIKVVPPRSNQFEERRFRQIEPRDRIEKGGGDGIGLGLARMCPFERVPPPLEPDFAKQGLGDDFAHAGDFETESIEGVDMRPRLARNKKAREPAVSIVAAEQSLAIGVIPVWRRLPLRIRHGQKAADAAPFAEQDGIGTRGGPVDVGQKAGIFVPS